MAKLSPNDLQDELVNYQDTIPLHISMHVFFQILETLKLSSVT